MATEFSHNEEQQNAQNNIYKEGQTSGKMTIAEAIERLSEIVKKNENYMAQAFANAPEWQQRAMMTMTTFDEKNIKEKSHTVVNVPSSFTKEQKEALKEYATQMGGTYTDMKVAEQGPDGTASLAFTARIEFGKDAAYTPEVCAKMLIGEEKESIVKEILASANQNKQLIGKDKEKKKSNSDDQHIADQKKRGLKL